MDEKRQAIEAMIEDRQGGQPEDLAAAAQGDRKIQFVIVTLAGRLYALLGTTVIAIAKLRDIVPIPGTPDYVMGVMYHRGRVESVIDIGKIMGLEDTPIGRKSRVVIAASDDVYSGVLVGAVEDVVDLPSSGIYAPLETIQPEIREFVAGETSYREQSVVILDLAKIFNRVLGQRDDAV